MVTITEDYCSREIYRLLIEKGFDGEIHITYDKEVYTQASITLQMAMKWLREEFEIHITILLLEKEEGNYGYTIEDINDRKYLGTSKSNSYNTHKEACEAAIRYCLENLI